MGHYVMPKPSAARLPLVGHPLVVVSAAALLGSLAARAAFPCLLLLVIWLVAHVRSRRWAVLCFMAFAAFGIAAEGARGRYRELWSIAAERFAGLHRCTLVGAVASSPTSRRSLSEPGRLDEAFLLRVHSGVCGERAVAAGTVIRLTRDGASPLVRGDVLDLVADVGPLRLFRNASLADPFDGAARHGAALAGRILEGQVVRSGVGLHARIDRARSRVRARIAHTYAPAAAALGRALVLGESDLDAEDGEAFRKSGLMHLLAVSGTHLVIAVLALVEGLRALLVRVAPLARRFDVARLSAFIGLLLSGLYADFAGGSGSAWRAAYMLGLVLGARVLGRRLRGGAALGGSLLLGLVVDPLVGSDVSFLLSALATAGLIGLGQPLSLAVSKGVCARFPLRPVVTSLVATLSATVTCAPVLALMDGHMTLSALVANVVAGPFGEVLALPACLLHAVATPWPAVEQGLALVGSGALLAVRAIALWSARQSAVAFELGMPDAWDCASLTALFVCWPAIQRSARAIWQTCGWGWTTGGITAICLGILVSGSWFGQSTRGAGSDRLLTVTALDVDQGDALIVDFPDGSLAVVDGGGFATGLPDTGLRVVLPYLRARGRREVDLMILSHVHPDHLLGLVTVAKHLRVRELWLLAPRAARGKEVLQLLAEVRRAGGRVRGASELCSERAGKDVREFGSTKLTVLVPCDAETTWTEASENDRSLVVHLRHGAHAALLTGDIEHDGESRLLAQAPLQADLLKIPHHGSDTSSGAQLLAAVNPRFAFISCGVRNRFEHPRASVLERLAGAGVRTLRTDRLGSISWLTDGRQTWLRGFSGAGPT